MRLSDIAQVIRSKNAGPRRLTLDIMFASDADYQRVAQHPHWTRDRIAALYRVPATDVTVIPTRSAAPSRSCRPVPSWPGIQAISTCMVRSSTRPCWE